MISNIDILRLNVFKLKNLTNVSNEIINIIQIPSMSNLLFIVYEYMIEYNVNVYDF